MEIVRLPINELSMYRNDSELYSSREIDSVKKDIEAHGNKDTIGIWGESNVIMTGHERFIALRELGYTEADCVRLDHLTAKERKEYMLAHISQEDTPEIGRNPEEFDFEFKTTEEIAGAREYDTDEISDDKFKCTCPRCGFKFNS